MKIGDIVTLGTYPQGEDKSIRSGIEWQVLKIEDGAALLLSVKALDYQMYHEAFRSTSWRSCTLRRWLNETFLAESFAPEEQQQLLDTDT